MKVYSEISLTRFEFWGGAKDRAKILTYEEMEQIEEIIEELYPDGMTETQLNDLMWFDFDDIKSWLGIDDEDDEE